MDMAQNGALERDLSGKRHRAAMCLLLSGNATEAEASGGVGRRTLCRWIKEPQLKSMLVELEKEGLAATSRRLVGISEKALRTIDDILASESASEGLKLCAAFGILDHALKWREQIALEDRITALERKLGVEQ